MLCICSGKSIGRCMYQSKWMDHIHFTIIVIRCALFCWCLCLSMHLIRMDWCTVRDFQTDDLWPTDDGQQKFGSTKKKVLVQGQCQVVLQHSSSGSGNSFQETTKRFFPNFSGKIPKFL